MAFRLGNRGLWVPGRQLKPAGTPRINWSHPLAKHLICYFFDTGEDIVELVRIWPRNLNGVPASNGDVSPFGPAMRWLGVQDTSVSFATSGRDPRLRTLSVRGFTASCAVFQTGEPSSNSSPSATEAGVFGRVYANGNGGADSMFWWGFVYYRIATGLGEYALLFRDSTSGLATWVAPFNTASWSGLTTLNNYHTLMLTMNGAGDTGNAYADGYNLTTSGTAINYIAHDGGDTTDHIVFGNKTASTSQSNNSDIPYPGGYIFWGACWDRELTYQEHVQLHHDPYCLLLPANEPLVIITFIPPTEIPAAVDLAVTNVIDIGSPLLGLEKVLFAAGIVNPSPVIGAGSFINAIPLPVGKTVGSPTIGAPALTRLIGSLPFTTQSPTIGAPALVQKHIFTTANFVVAPAFSIPVFHQSGDTIASDFVVSRPTIAVAVLGQKHVIAAAAALTIAPPQFGFALVSQSLIAAAFTTSAPVIVPSSLTRTFVLHAGNLIISGPAFLVPEAEEIGPPVAWLRHRLKRWSRDPDAEYYDEDDTEDEGPVQQAIFSNRNDDIELTASHLTLVGRTSPERGPAEAIDPQLPLFMFDRKLWVDWSQVEQLRVDLTAEIAARAAAVSAEGATRAAADAAISASVALLRQVVSTPTTFYVSTSGNDANDGSAGAPWRTVQYTARRVSYLDIRADVTVQIADGTYDESVVFYPAIGGNGAFVYFTGNVATPANCVLRSIALYQGSVLPYVFDGIRLAPTASGHLVNANGAQVYLSHMEYAAAVGAYAHIRGGANSILNFEWPYKITGGATHHLLGAQGAKFYCYGSPVTITGTPTFSQAFAWVEDGGSMILTSGVTFSGAVNAATKKYRAQVNGIIQTFGSGVNYFPGGVVGDVVTGGQYL